jgi:hypothetical protein
MSLFNAVNIHMQPLGGRLGAGTPAIALDPLRQFGLVIPTNGLRPFLMRLPSVPQSLSPSVPQSLKSPSVP